MSKGPKLKILLVHNSYQSSGGEDRVFQQERRLLEEKGHDVLTYTRSNHETADFRGLSRLALAKKSIWADDVYRDVTHLLRQERPRLAHIHNTFALISPSVYWACREMGVPVVQTLHNYRLLCPKATLYRQGQVCERCLGKMISWPAVVHACYRESSLKSAVVAVQLLAHWTIGTWEKQIDRYLVPSYFAKEKVVEGGLPEDKVSVKPNFVHPAPSVAKTGPGRYVLYVGRLSPEKGVRTLIHAWAMLARDVPLRLAGEGPLRSELEQLSCRLGLPVSFDGLLPRAKVLQLLREARFLVFPSEWFETFGLVIVEAYASSVPVVAARLGAAGEIVRDGETGLHFVPGSAEDLAEKAEWAWSHPESMIAMGRAARQEYEMRYTAASNYELLMQAYSAALASRGL